MYSWNIAHLPFTLNDTRCFERTVKSKLIDIQYIILVLGLGVVVFIVTFTNISVKSWGSVLLVEVTGVPRENHWPMQSHWKALSHNVVWSTPRLSRIQTLNVNVYLFVRYLVFDDSSVDDDWKDAWIRSLMYRNNIWIKLCSFDRKMSIFSN